MLEQIIPFRYLSPEQRDALRADLTECVFQADEVLIEQDDESDKRVFLLAEGSVRVMDRNSGRRGRSRIVTTGHYIGERAALFDERRGQEVRAVDRVRALTMSGERFLRLVHESTPFAQALGSILRDKQGIFAPFDRFHVELLRAVARGSVDLQRLLPFYRELDPALHPHASTRDVIDFGALTYAVRRLPENVTRTLSFYLTGVLPELYANPDNVGNLLTVTGTLMQNRTMLHFNRHIWRCIGLEMEGAFYLRHLAQSMSRGAIADDMDLRFLYYTSDLPLRHDSNLSARLRAAEGVPPLYAITREVLTGILETQAR